MRIEAEGLIDTEERMRARSERLLDLSDPLRTFGEGIVTQTDTGFATEKNFDGTPFAPLADSTLAARASEAAAGKQGIKAQRAELRTKLKTGGKTDKQIAQALRKQSLKYQLKRIGWAVGMSSAERTIAIEQARRDYEKKKAIIELASGSGTIARGVATKKLKDAHASYERKKKAIQDPKAYKILTDTARARNSNHVSDVTRSEMQWSAVGYLAFHMSGTKRMPARNPTAFVWNGTEWALHDKAQETLRSKVLRYVKTGEDDE